MYLNFFNLREPPFNLTPDPRFLFLSPPHEEALSHLLYGIHERKGFIEITGEVGTGKTILCRALLDRLDATVSTALIFNSYLNDVELLQAIIHDFGLSCQDTTRKGYIDILNQYLLQEFATGRNAVVVIDEAQNLESRVLEQLRMLSNLETERGKLVQVILVGQPELRDKLAAPQMRQLDQRIAVRCHIHSLTRRELLPYISHRLSVAGGANALTFTPRALTRIYRHCAGTPRRINLLCDRILLTAYVRGTRRVTSRIVRQSLQDLDGSWQSVRRWWPGWRPVLFRTVLAISGTLGLISALSGALLLAGRQEHLSPFLSAQVLARIHPAAPPSPQPVPALAAPTAAPTPPSPLQLTEADLQLARTLWQLKAQAESGLLRSATTSSMPWELTLRQPASSTGLDVLQWQAGFAQLARVLRPCFIEVVSESPTLQPHLWVLVKGLADQVLIYREPEGLIAIPLQHLRRIWYGKLYLTLEEGKYRGAILRQGMQGARVHAVQQVLKDLGYFSDGLSGRFDVQTVQAVKGFQRDHQLMVDGHVGRQTLMVLWHFGSHILEETT